MENRDDSTWANAVCNGRGSKLNCCAVCWTMGNRNSSRSNIIMSIKKDDDGSQKVKDALLNNQMHLGMMQFACSNDCVFYALLWICVCVVWVRTSVIVFVCGIAVELTISPEEKKMLVAYAYWEWWVARIPLQWKCHWAAIRHPVK